MSYLPRFGRRPTTPSNRRFNRFGDEYSENMKLSEMVMGIPKWEHPLDYSPVARHIFNKRRPRFAALSRILDTRPGLSRNFIRLLGK